MRTTDFSRAPKQARAEAMVIVEASRDAIGRESPRALAHKARTSAGFVWLATIRRRWFEGAVVCFASRAAADAFAASLSIGWLHKVLVAEESGYSNGVWRAEANVMQHIDRFTPTTTERDAHREPPEVAGPVSNDIARAGRRETTAETARLETRRVTDSEAMFIGATRYRGPRALRVLSRTWYPMISRMRGLSGYVWHRVYWEPPFTLGTLAFFRTRDDLLGFARMPAHRMLMQWITRDTANGTGGYIRLHTAPDGSEDRA